jgi:cephalosporin hydroxylase
VVAAVRPGWIVETGTKFGGSAIFFASLLEGLGLEDSGVITVDIERTPRAAEVLATHRLRARIKAALVADAAAPETVAEIRQIIDARPGPVLVFLDDWHDGEHVYQEMAQYAEQVTPNSYLIVADTVFADLADTPIVTPSPKYPDAAASNPRAALRRFLAERGDFQQELHWGAWGISNFPDGFLRKQVVIQ